MDAANDAKPRGIFSDQGAFKKRLFHRVKHTGAWTSIRGTMVTGTVIAVTESCDFHVIVITLTP